MKFRHIVLLGIALFFFLMRMRPARFFGSPSPGIPASVPERVRITQFYAATPRIGLGDKTLLCYGVENAKTVRLTPPVETVWPALARCFEVVPPRTTKYTLTADDAHRQSVTESTAIEVGPARPKLVDISVNKLRVAPGELITLCFKARNATKYDVGRLKPVALQVAGGQGQSVATPEHGCFADHPRKTTTYVVKVTGPGGEDSEKVTVTVK
jgi:hypothetical protein